MSIENLVPPLELCKLIPAGEFEDSAFCWIDKEHSAVLPTEIAIEPQPFVELRRYTIHGDEIPAPTTDEILAECKDIHRVLNPTVWWQGTWKTDCAINKSDKLIEECLEDADFNDLDIVETQDDNAATAALKLWLKLKGINCE
jgi:hypothetical protein